MGQLMSGKGQPGTVGATARMGWNGLATGALQRWFLAASLVLAGLAVVAAIAWPTSAPGPASFAQSHVSRWTLDDIPFDGQKAYEWLKRLCALGPRISGSPGMAEQQKILAAHFQKLGAQVTFQSFPVRHPLDGSRVDLRNLWVQFHPERTERILLCAHYDTRPWPDRDADLQARRSGVFLGANDGASGVALLSVLAERLPQLPGKWGVDIVFFDGEEFVYDEQRDEYFLGSTHFAQQWVGQLQPFHYRCAILLDMVADAQLQIYQERLSMRWPDTRPWVESIWATARQLEVREFIASRKHEVRDDHVPLHDIARIPSLDIIDFDYPWPGGRVNYWHTTRDIPENCSALSLAKVGWVLQTWLEELAAQPELKGELGRVPYGE
jgi:hypothetical protein